MRLNNRLLPTAAARPQPPRCSADTFSLFSVEEDSQPSNIFLVEGSVERIKILDFGIARRVVLSKQMTRTGSVLGTPEYMAPEQARGYRDIGPSADIFSLGCVLFECLTGQPPFLSDHIAAVLAKILFEDPPLLRSLRPELPASLEALITRMLAKNGSCILHSAGCGVGRRGKALGKVGERRGNFTPVIYAWEGRHPVSYCDGNLILR